MFLKLTMASGTNAGAPPLIHINTAIPLLPFLRTRLLLLIAIVRDSINLASPIGIAQIQE